jgi:ribosomal protein L16 Arg81 hydroxylase
MDEEGAMAPTCLTELLQPYSVQEFLTSTWGKCYQYLPGEPGRFSRLLPWSRLNAILDEHRLDFPRVRLIKDGEQLPASDFLSYSQGRHGEQIPRLKAGRLNELLREGATLAVNSLQEVARPIRELAENLEHVLRERINVNAYAGWGTSHGFDLHWDDHDVFVLQVAGRKRWKIYGDTGKFPQERADAAQEEAPKEPVWEQILEDGDLLYIPRGWWHVAIPLAEPTLHLTVGSTNRTGVDFLRWLQEELRTQPLFRQDLPRFATEAEQMAHMERLREELFALWDEVALKRFLFHHDSRAVARPRFSLPWSVAPDVLPPTDEACVRLLMPRSTSLSIALLKNEKLRPFAPHAEEVLCPLLDGEAHSIREVCARAAATADRETVRAFLGELVLQGLLSVSTPE